MDITQRVQFLENQCEKLQMQVDKLCELMKVGLDYKPHSYEAYEVPKQQEDIDG